MSPVTDAQLTLLDQRLQALEKREYEDIRELHRAYEEGRREASLALAAYLTIQHYDKDTKDFEQRVEFFVNSLLKDVEHENTRNTEAIGDLRRDFDAYKTAQETREAEALKTQKESRAHRFTVVTTLLFVLFGLLGGLIGLLNYLGVHVTWH